MHGLTVFQHHIVGDVHDVVDGPHPIGAEPLAQPLGAGADFYVGHHPGGVAVAQLGGRHFHIQIVIDAARIAAMHHRLVVTHVLAESSGSFPGQADDGVAVRTVVGDFKIHHGIVVADYLVDVLTHLAIFVVENPNAVGVGVGEVVLGQAQLGEGAEHTVGQFPPELALGDVDTPGQPGVVQGHGHQIPFGDVLSTGDDLNRLFLAHVHLADPHMVGVGVADHGQHLAHHHVFHFSVHPLIGFHLLTENGQGFHKFLVGDLRKVYEIFIEPFSVQFHSRPLLRTDSGTGRRCRRSDAGH